MNQGSPSSSSLFTRLSVQALRIVCLGLAIYVLGLLAYGYYHYDGTKARLLTYGISSATSSLIATLVLLVALSIPAFSILRIMFGRGRPADLAFALALPLITWITSLIPANFDATSGKPLRFCAQRPDGSLFCLDHEGIDPVTSRKLIPIDTATAEVEFRRERGLAPKLISNEVSNVQFFDPLTGSPKVFFAKNDSDCFDLYDNPGADPKTGEKLVPATKDLVHKLSACRRSKVAQPSPEVRSEVVPAVAPSFDCAKATWKSERMICASQTLAILDLSMSNAYRDAIARSPENASALRNAQNHWIRSDRESCNDESCLQQLYEARIRDLKQY